MATSSPPFGKFERQIATRYLGAKRREGGVATIAVVSFIGITLAVMALIVTMSIMNGFRETLLSRILGIGGHVFVDVRGLPPAQVAEVARRTRGVAGVTHVAQVVDGQALASGENGATGVYVRGISQEDLKALSIVSQQLARGDSIVGFDDLDDPKLLIGSRLAAQLSIFQGSTLTLLSPNGAATPFGVVPRRKAFTVGALFTVGAADYDSTFVFMPLSQAQTFFARGDSVDMLEVRVADPADPAPVERAMRTALGPDLIITDWKDLHASLVTALIVERNMMRIILMIVVAITAINIVTGLVMLVKNKGRDIAILRTIGASRGAILRIFFMAGAAIGAIGTLVGVILGVLFCLNIGAIQSFVEYVTHTQVFNPEVYSLSRLPAKLDPGEIALIVAWGLFVSFVATIYPAWLGSRLDPVEALRYE